MPTSEQLLHRLEIWHLSMIANPASVRVVGRSSWSSRRASMIGICQGQTELPQGHPTDGRVRLCARLANQLFNLTLSQLSSKESDQHPFAGSGRIGLSPKIKFGKPADLQTGGRAYWEDHSSVAQSPAREDQQESFQAKRVNIFAPWRCSGSASRILAEKPCSCCRGTPRRRCDNSLDFLR